MDHHLKKQQGNKTEKVLKIWTEVPTRETKQNKTKLQPECFCGIKWGKKKISLLPGDSGNILFLSYLYH